MTVPENPVADGADDPSQVGENERLFRRLLKGTWYKPGKPRIIPQTQFMPRAWKSDEQPGDTDGLSVNRKKYTSVAQTSPRPDTGELQPVCEFGVRDLRQLELSVQPKPEFANRSHAVIPELNSLDRRDPEKEEWMAEKALALRDCAILVFQP